MTPEQLTVAIAVATEMAQRELARIADAQQKLVHIGSFLSLVHIHSAAQDTLPAPEPEPETPDTGIKADPTDVQYVDCIDGNPWLTSDGWRVIRHLFPTKGKKNTRALTDDQIRISLGVALWKKDNPDKGWIAVPDAYGIYGDSAYSRYREWVKAGRIEEISEATGGRLDIRNMIEAKRGPHGPRLAKAVPEPEPELGMRNIRCLSCGRDAYTLKGENVICPWCKSDNIVTELEPMPEPEPELEPLQTGNTYSILEPDERVEPVTTLKEQSPPAAPSDIFERPLSPDPPPHRHVWQLPNHGDLREGLTDPVQTCSECSETKPYDALGSNPNPSQSWLHRDRDALKQEEA